MLHAIRSESLIQSVFASRALNTPSLKLHGGVSHIAREETTCLGILEGGKGGTVNGARGMRVVHPGGVLKAGIMRWKRAPRPDSGRGRNT